MVKMGGSGTAGRAAGSGAAGDTVPGPAALVPVRAGQAPVLDLLQPACRDLGISRWAAPRMG
ncbi:hypothetical protein, partial [Arthrobacter sp. Bi83]|uniref:hypothetical protein n=1 Tax=Arthrobacter sp. Bi83 TaxID=2822353 RepID=UPI001E5C4225